MVVIVQNAQNPTVEALPANLLAEMRSLGRWMITKADVRGKSFTAEMMGRPITMRIDCGFLGQIKAFDAVTSFYLRIFGPNWCVELTLRMNKRFHATKMVTHRGAVEAVQNDMFNHLPGFYEEYYKINRNIFNQNSLASMVFYVLKYGDVIGNIIFDKQKIEQIEKDLTMAKMIHGEEIMALE